MNKINTLITCLTFCLAVLATPLLAAEWNAGGGINRNWSELSNWVGSTDPAGTDIRFGIVGATNSSTPPTSVVDSTQSILSLTYQYSSPTNFQTTEILDGVTLNVGGTSLTNVFQVGGFSGSTTTITNTAVVIKGAGTLNINQSGGTISIANYRTNNGAAYTAELDMSGLAVFQANLGSTGAFNIGVNHPTNTSTSQHTQSTVLLADQNTITAGALHVGSTILNTQISVVLDTKNPSHLYLGRENTLNVDTIYIARGYASRVAGILSFDASVLGDSPEVTIRGVDGVSAVSEVKIAVNDSSTSSDQFGSVDFSGGRVDALINNLTIGSGANSGISSNSAVGSLTMDEGIITAANVIVGQSKGNNTVSINTGTINVNGGTFNATNLKLAERTANLQKATGILNITSTGTVTVSNGIVMGNSATGTNTLTATVNLDGGSLSVHGNIAEGSGSGIQSTLNLRGGSLNLNGNNIAVDTFNAESGTLQNVGQFNGGADFVKTTADTLIIAGNNTYTGATVVEAGTVELSGSISHGNVMVKNAAQFNLLNTGTLKFNITGLSTADSFVVEAGGVADFDGTLRFDLAADYGTASWNLFSGTAVGNYTNLSTITLSGAFVGSLSDQGGNLWGTTIGDHTFEFNTASGALSVNVIPEPGMFALVAFGALALLIRRRRR